MNPWDLSCRPKQALEPLDSCAHFASLSSSLASSSFSSSSSSSSPSQSSSSSLSSYLFSLQSSPEATTSTKVNNHPDHTLLPSNLPDLCLASPNILDRKAKKKDQNRRAAHNYRRKKIEEKNKIREDEMRLVYSRVCLTGYLEKLESTIIYILNQETHKVLDKDGRPISYFCPICPQSCDNIVNLRKHLNDNHNNNYSNINQNL